MVVLINCDRLLQTLQSHVGLYYCSLRYFHNFNRLLLFFPGLILSHCHFKVLRYCLITSLHFQVQHCVNKLFYNLHLSIPHQFDIGSASWTVCWQTISSQFCVVSVCVVFFSGAFIFNALIVFIYTSNQSNANFAFWKLQIFLKTVHMLFFWHA